MKNQFNFDYFFIDSPYKDLSDMIKHTSLKEAKKMIKLSWRLKHKNHREHYTGGTKENK